ncbi:YrhB domain-containing protein [Labrenzia sp. OB1]|uniref:YrhB domain-containing protein n=1 Tax=Labrenzia sp. OB1 TaxID=1561204 RepID=UPI0018FE3C0A|nr:YrhB domain-containing protein [Labrenzia sp. OB1]
MLVGALLAQGISGEANNNMDIVTAQQAEKYIADEVLTQSSHDFVIQRDKTLPRPFGFVVFYTTREFVRTGNPTAQVPGAGPVIVMRNGEIVPLTTSLPPAKAIQRFEEEWLKAKGAPKR